MKNQSGVVILAVIFIGMFSLLAGLVGGAFMGAKAAVDKQAYNEPTALK